MSDPNDNDVAQCLAQWPLWPLGLKWQPEVVAELRGGRTNKSYLIEADAQRYVLRLENKNPHSLGIRRDFEMRVYQALAPLGICPQLHFSHLSLPLDHVSRHYSIFEYIHGRTWTAQDFKQPEQRAKLHKVIARYQQQKMLGPAFDYIAHLAHYRQQLMAVGMNDGQLKNESYHFFIRSFKSYLNSNPCRVLTHHDLNPKNIIETLGRLVILDWEYAGLGLSEFDPHSFDQHLLVKPTFDAQASEAGIIFELFYWLNYYWFLVQNIE